MIISLISALTINHIIGRKNSIPWDCPIDVAWFKYHTVNKPVIMGRRTFESIGNKPLLNRLNIVVSHRLLSCDYNKNIVVVNDPIKALSLIGGSNEVMVIGGGAIYSIFFPYATRLYLTYIHTTDIQGDTWFPKYDANEWKLIFNKFFQVNRNCCYSLTFKIFVRF